MSTTIIPPCKPVHPDVTPEYIKDVVYGWFQHVMGDYDKAGDMPDSYFYEGEASALDAVLTILTSAPDDSLAPRTLEAVAAAADKLPFATLSNLPLLVRVALNFIPDL